MRRRTRVVSAGLVIVWAIVVPARPAAAADITVVQRNKSFVLREVTVREVTIKVGDRIVFLNDDEISHNVFSRTPGLEFEIRTQQPGQSDVVRFEKVGVVAVECAMHPKMKLLVTVTR